MFKFHHDIGTIFFAKTEIAPKVAVPIVRVNGRDLILSKKQSTKAVKKQLKIHHAFPDTVVSLTQYYIVLLNFMKIRPI